MKNVCVALVRLRFGLFATIAIGWIENINLFGNPSSIEDSLITVHHRYIDIHQQQQQQKTRPITFKHDIICIKCELIPWKYLINLERTSGKDLVEDDIMCVVCILTRLLSCIATQYTYTFYIQGNGEFLRISLETVISILFDTHYNHVTWK